MLIATTPRLLIRQLDPNDLQALIPILSDKTVMEFSTTGPLSESKIQLWLNEIISGYGQPGPSIYAIILKDENKLIGFCGINPTDLDGRTEIEILFRLAQNYWNQGYAFEATHAVIQYAFNTLAINEIIAVLDPRNQRSLNVIQKLQMSYEKDSVYKGFPVQVYRLKKF